MRKALAMKLIGIISDSTRDYGIKNDSENQATNRMYYMQQRQFTTRESLDLVFTFTDALWRECKERFSEDTLEDMGNYLGALHGDPAIPDDWKEAYSRAFGREYPSDRPPLNETEIFTTMIEICAMYIYRFQFKLEELLQLLFLMRYRPNDYVKECALWQEGIQYYLDFDSGQL